MEIDVELIDCCLKLGPFPKITILYCIVSIRILSMNFISLFMDIEFLRAVFYQYNSLFQNAAFLSVKLLS